MGFCFSTRLLRLVWHFVFKTLTRVSVVFSVAALAQAEGVASEKTSGAQRIIALSPHSVELLYSIGAGDRIVGTTQFADYPESANDIPRIGGYNAINIERVLELKPDLIVVWASGNPSADLQQMKKLGLPTYESNPKKVDQIAHELIQLGKLTGLEENAKKVASDFLAQLNAARSQHANKAKVRFFYQLWPKPLRGIGPGSWINEIMTICGGENILHSGFSDYPEINVETVLLAKPEVILWPDHHGRETEKVHWEHWPEIPAVKNGHIYELEGDHMHRFTVRILQGMNAVCDVFEKARAAG